MSFYQETTSVGLVHFMAFPECMTGEGPILDSLQTLLDDDFFQAVEMTHIADGAVRKEVARRIAASGKWLGYGAHPLILGGKLNIHSRDRVNRARSLARLKQAIGEAAEMGAKGFVVMSGTDPGHEFRSEETDILVESLDRLCTWVRETESGMHLVIETFDRAGYGKNCLVGPTGEAVEIAKRVRERHPNFGILLDLSHLPLLNESPAESVPAAREVLVHAHVGNCVCRVPDDPYYGDNHPPFGFDSGENGVDELADFLQNLRTVGYLREGTRSVVSAEIRPMGDLTTADVIENTKQTLRAAWKRLEA